MDQRITSWIRELRRFNPGLHLMGPAMLTGVEGELQAMMPLLENIREPEIADLGSGSGLPGIPFKVLHPRTKVVLIERSVKKCTFLRHTVEVLGLSEVEILCADPLHVEGIRFDAVMARSFSPTATLEKVCGKILGEGGRLYYLFTGRPPVLGTAFRHDGTFSETFGTHRINCAVFTHLP